MYRNKSLIYPYPIMNIIFNRYLISLCLIIPSVLISPDRVDAFREARAILAREVGAIAKKTTVRIESADGDFGSGVIIGRTERGTKNIYTILTAAHVVRTPNINYRIITPVPLNQIERKRITINLDTKKSIKILPDVDLAVISIESNYTFAIGTIGDSSYADEGSPVYVAGFPKPGKAIKRIALQFTGGMISSRLDDADQNPKDQSNGYDLAYTNITRVGMSGGPVFDAAGRVVAIHGQGDRNNQAPSEEISNGVASDEKTGFNLGIPIQTLFKLQPQARTVIGVRVDKSPINYQLSDNSYMIGTNNKKFTRKFRTRAAISPLMDVTKVNEKYD
jgi:serine protease Do